MKLGQRPLSDGMADQQKPAADLNSTIVNYFLLRSREGKRSYLTLKVGNNSHNIAVVNQRGTPGIDRSQRSRCQRSLVCQ